MTGTTVAHIDSHNTPTYAEYDLITGQKIRGPIELPWLKSIVDAQTESGKTTYAVAGVACPPAPSPQPDYRLAHADSGSLPRGDVVQNATSHQAKTVHERHPTRHIGKVGDPLTILLNLREIRGPPP